MVQKGTREAALNKWFSSKRRTRLRIYSISLAFPPTTCTYEEGCGERLVRKSSWEMQNSTGKLREKLHR